MTVDLASLAAKADAYRKVATTSKLEVAKRDYLLALGDLLAAIGTPAPTPTPTPVPQPSDIGANLPTVLIGAGVDIAATVANSPAGTRFMLAGSVYSVHGVVPKNGDVFVGASRDGTILDGAGSSPHAFTGQAADVTIANMTIRNFKPARQFGAIDAVASLRWQMLGLHVTKNAAEGIVVGKGSLVANCLCDYNGNVGLGTGNVTNPAGNVPIPGLTFTVQDCELAYNGQGDPEDAAGAKILWSAGAKLIRVNAHHNNGFGLWNDDWCEDTIYQDCIATDNLAGGIFDEISARTKILNPTALRNAIGWGTGNFYAGTGGVCVSDSIDCEVSGGIVHGNQDSVVGYNGHQLGRLRNLQVHGVDMDGGQAGIQNYQGDPIAFSSSRFYNNKYPAGQRFWWASGPTDLAGWNAAGQS